MTERDIKNKVAVVTGGAKGIGLAIVEEFLKEEAKNVIFIDVDDKEGPKIAEQLNSKYGDEKVFFIKADVTEDLDAVFEKVIAKFKSVDILVNNAGVADEGDFRRTLNINAVATVEWSMKFLEHMRKDNGGKGGSILNVASMYGFLVDPFLVYYKTSKFAVMGFTQSIGHVATYNVTGVRVVALCPGFVRTDLPVKARWNEALQFLRKPFEKYLAESDWQDTGDVSRAAVDALRAADSGTAWYVKNGEKIKQVPILNSLINM